MRHCTNFIFAILFVLLPGAAHAEDKFFDSKGVQIHYVEEGSGPPVVLVHGYAVAIDSQWGVTGVFGNLAKDHHVIALDDRGHGLSGKPHEATAYGVQMTEDVVRLMDHLKIRRAHIVGYSMGSMVVMKMLATHPDRFLTATLGGMGLQHLNAPDFEKDASAFEHGDFKTLVLAIWPSNQPPPTEEMIRQRSEQIAGRPNADAVALARVWGSLPSLDVTDAQMAAVRVPTEAVVGGNDPLLAGVNNLKKVQPSLQVTVVDGGNHLNTAGRPEFVAAIRDFIDKAQPAG